MVQSTRLFPRSMGRWLMALLLVMVTSLAARAAEAYACYTSSNTTLTFYYDNQRNSRSGTTYDLNTGSNDTGWDTDGTKDYVTCVVFDPSFTYARPKTTYDWFYNMVNLQSITGINYLNTSEVTNMAYMFCCCYNLTSIDVSHFNTSKVTNMYSMFYYCTSLQTIYVGDGWSTAAVTSSDDMFRGCTSLVGGKGTSYDADHVDKAYAHIDYGTAYPGYLTDAHAVVAYTCYTPDNTTLTFYYDDQRRNRQGTTYDLNTGGTDTGWETAGTSAHVTRVVFDPSFANARPTTTYSWFYSMNNLQSITGMKEYLNTSEVTNMSWMFGYCEGLTSIDLNGFNTSNVTNMAGMFYGCSGISELDLSTFNTSNVNNMTYMFIYCYNLATIYVLNGWSTDEVIYGNQLFTDCNNLVGGYGTVYDSSHVGVSYAHIDGGPSNPGYFTKQKEAYACYTPGNTTLTFYYDTVRSSRSGTTYGLNTGFNDPEWQDDQTIRYVTHVIFDPTFANARPVSTYNWFWDLSDLQSITGMDYLNTEAVTVMGGMFAYSPSLTTLDLSGFNTSKVTDMSYMFYNCNNLQTIFVRNGWNTVAVTNSRNMFSNCTSLVGGQGTPYDANHVDKAYARIDGGPSNPGYFTEGREAYACYTPSNTTLTFYYDTERATRPGTTYNLNPAYTNPGWFTDGTKSNVTQVVFDPSFANARPTTTYSWCYGMEILQTITGMSYLNTSEVTNMAYMFLSCPKLTRLDLSSFNTSKVINMNYMFCNCRSLRTIYVSDGWNTSAVVNSYNMFSGSTSLVGGQGTTFDPNHVDAAYAHIDGGPSNPGYFTAEGAAAVEAYAVYTVGNTTLTFYFDTERSTREGTTYDLNVGLNGPGWYRDGNNTSVSHVVFDPSFANARPVSTSEWFWGMSNLQSITGMDCLNTEAVTYTWGMFAHCSKLTTLDLSSFNTSKVINMSYMFYNCNNLRTIYVGNGWSTAAVTNSDYMFSNCTSLVGGQGTTYDANHIDKAYAHIDGGASNPGYFTAKTAFQLGDVNRDGQVNIADVTTLISMVLNSNATAASNPEADLTGDGSLNIADVTTLISLVLHSA